MTPLDVSSERSDGRAHVALRGELDLTTVGAAEAALAEIERAPGARLLVVRGPEAVDRVFRLALLDGRLTLVDHPGDEPADARATGA